VKPPRCGQHGSKFSHLVDCHVRGGQPQEGDEKDTVFYKRHTVIFNESNAGDIAMHIRNSVKIIFQEWRKESGSDDYLFNKKDKKEEIGLVNTVG
jgi:hypothetical protein